MHAVMNYPTEHHNAQLSYIKHLSEKWGRPVGYSSHDVDWEACLFAAALGADFIERHVTHSRMAPGLDHSSSSEIAEAQKLASLIGAFQLLYGGSGPRFPNQGEMMNLQNLGRSYYALQAMSSGTCVEQQHFAYRSPRRGLGPREALQAWGTPLLKPISVGDALHEGHFCQPISVESDLLTWANGVSIGIPIRPHDWSALSESVPLRTREFHLSYQDVRLGLTTDGLPSDCLYSVHLPDYVTSTDLMNPYSKDRNIREGSRRLLEECMSFAQRLQQLSGSTVPVVGSFSLGKDGPTASFFEGQRELVEDWTNASILLLHQWLPPFAWYFGGSIPITRFNSREDLELCNAYGLQLCFDTAHAAMCVNANRARIEDFAEFSSLFLHSHVAGARGIDSEGVSLSDADNTCKELVIWAMSLPTRKILERWQGHLSDGLGFREDLSALYEMLMP